MKSFKIGITGLRGIVGELLTPELATLFAQAYGTYLDGGEVFVCRDTRASGKMLSSAVFAGLISCGCKVIDLGICPTPSMQIMVRDSGASGGISISGGHNSWEWNALKFVRSDGMYLNEYQAEELLDIYHQGDFKKAKWNEIIKVENNNIAIDKHIEKLKSILDIDKIKKRKIKVALDCCNGSCSALTPKFLSEIGCEVFAINDSLEDKFPHNPDPTPSNMSQLKAIVKASKADIGFAHDADGERLGIVTQKGEALNEEMTFCICEDMILRNDKGSIVTNLSTTSAVDEIAKIYQSEVIRTKIGQVYISETLRDKKAVVGGEGSGGVVIPTVSYFHDAVAAVSLIINFLVVQNCNISEISDLLPKFALKKVSLAIAPFEIYRILQKVREYVEKEYDPNFINLEDGIRVNYEKGWFHIRASKTEPLLRITVETKSEHETDRMLSYLITLIKG